MEKKKPQYIITKEGKRLDIRLMGILRRNKNKKLCKRGHELTPNKYKKGKRECRICRSYLSRLAHYRKKHQTDLFLHYHIAEFELNEQIQVKPLYSGKET